MQNVIKVVSLVKGFMFIGLLSTSLTLLMCVVTDWAFGVVDIESIAQLLTVVEFAAEAYIVCYVVLFFMTPRESIQAKES